MIEIDLIKALSNRDSYSKYSKYVKQHAISENTNKLIQDINLYFDTYPEIVDIDWSTFKTWFTLIANPSLSTTSQEEWNQIFDNIDAHSNTELMEDIVKHFIQLDYATTIADKVQYILDGSNKHSLEDIITDVEEYCIACDIDTTASSDTVTTELSAILDKCLRSGGYYWRLEDLNKGIGPLHKGDLVVVAARPESGKTSFATSELTHMAAQDADNRPVLIFNNEEMGEKIMLRCYSSAYNMSAMDVSANEASLAQLDYIQLIDKADLNVSYCEKLIRQINPCIVVFNVLDKVQGFNKIGSEVDRQRKLAQWARGLGKKYDTIVFAIAQADGSAEGEQWIYQNQIYGSKTGVPGEADVIITIGHTHDPANKNIRYIHVPKNKLPGDSKTVSSLRHGYFEVHFDGECGRYKSLTY